MPRTTLPTRRETHSIEVVHLWDINTPMQFEERIRIQYSALPNGEAIGEVVYEPDHARGNKTTTTNHDACILISLALQWGVPLKDMRDAVLHQRVNVMGTDRMMPSTQIGAILDALANEQGLDPVEMPDNPIDSPVTR